ncbi:hypothetical protein OR16_15977 [Cupriavidus basilensis OR16]|uniref:Uncharacterized protein n=1 Tax=Cupriavidus basilensis OR16 TaxID=1127483 RepID=H1S5Q4_9BURK|nr:hypothetical protein [Cupriavidus basilensis]EHP42136.1 hypothetical protein OR16_15977 [Cupriavidus basilensis OR16]
MIKASRRYFEHGLSAEAFDEICGADPEALRRLRLGISVLERRNLAVVKATAFSGLEEGIFLDLFIDASVDDCTALALLARQAKQAPRRRCRRADARGSAADARWQ